MGSGRVCWDRLRKGKTYCADGNHGHGDENLRVLHREDVIESTQSIL